MHFGKIIIPQMPNDKMLHLCWERDIYRNLHKLKNLADGRSLYGEVGISNYEGKKNVKGIQGSLVYTNQRE